jgi:tripartite-type tricarboxylate transporter receptor subunit TctC
LTVQAMRRFFATIGVMAAVAITFASSPAHADEVADFYKGRTVQVVVGYGPGGGNDVYARLLTRHMGRHIPGTPALVVQNMPGAGSLVAANHLANVAPKDGTVIGTFARNLPLAGVLGANPNIRFDAAKLTWLGSASSYRDDAYILWVRPEAKVTSIEAARRPGGEPLVLAGTSEGDTSYDVPVLLQRTLGLRIKLIGGYRDSNGMFMAIEGKEVDGRVADLSSVASSRAHWLKPGAMLTLLQFGRATRHKDFLNVPTARELAATDAERELIAMMEAPFALTRPYAAPGGVPAARAKALQAAFKAVQKDAAYLDEAHRLKLDVSPIGPEEVARLLARIAAAPETLKAEARKLVGGGK